MRYFGDIHGDRNQHIQKYVELTKTCDASVQVGDLGAGFTAQPLPVLAPSHRFIRGNHDDPNICFAHPNWIRDSTYEADTGTYFCGGGYSVDKDQRTIGRDWWPNEELTYSDLSKAIEHYAQCKPTIVVTHEAPASIVVRLFKGIRGASNTGLALEAMLDVWKPKVWIFGHHHVDINQIIEGVQFYCIGEMNYIDLDI